MKKVLPNCVQAIIALVLLLGLSGAMMYGYIHNIVSLAHATSVSGLAIAQAIGIVLPPVGVFLGWFI